MAKAAAAKRCVDECVRDGLKLGIGTGSTVAFLIDIIVEKYKDNLLKNIICVPTSIETKHRLMLANVPTTELTQCPQLDICIDGADEIDSHLNCIKGGGGALMMEKVRIQTNQQIPFAHLQIVMSCATQFIVIGDSGKQSRHLTQKFKAIPLEVVQSAWRPLSANIMNRFGGKCTLRTGTGKAGPLLSDNGNVILDWQPEDNFGQHVKWSEVNSTLLSMPGLLETGLFLDCVEKAYIGQENGEVKVIERK